eukprot:7883985-Alexandrium_andersonii.AAC.2
MGDNVEPTGHDGKRVRFSMRDKHCGTLWSNSSPDIAWRPDAWCMTLNSELRQRNAATCSRTSLAGHWPKPNITQSRPQRNTQHV